MCIVDMQIHEILQKNKYTKNFNSRLFPFYAMPKRIESSDKKESVHKDSFHE